MRSGRSSPCSRRPWVRSCCRWSVPGAVARDARRFRRQRPHRWLDRRALRGRIPETLPRRRRGGTWRPPHGLRLPRAWRLGRGSQRLSPYASRELGDSAAPPGRGPSPDTRVQAARPVGEERLVVGPPGLRLSERLDDAHVPQASGHVRVGARGRRHPHRPRRDRDHRDRRQRRARTRLDRRARARPPSSPGSGPGAARGVAKRAGKRRGANRPPGPRRAEGDRRDLALLGRRRLRPPLRRRDVRRRHTLAPRAGDQGWTRRTRLDLPSGHRRGIRPAAPPPERARLGLRAPAAARRAARDRRLAHEVPRSRREGRAARPLAALARGRADLLDARRRRRRKREGSALRGRRPRDGPGRVLGRALPA